MGPSRARRGPGLYEGLDVGRCSSLKFEDGAVGHGDRDCPNQGIEVTDVADVDRVGLDERKYALMVSSHDWIVPSHSIRRTGRSAGVRPTPSREGPPPI